MRANKNCQFQTEKLILPKKFASFLDISKANTWRTIFENPVVFKAGKKKGKNNNNDDLDLYIESSPPLFNIFYLLQVLAPGMLVIYHEYQLQNVDVKVSRVLPRASWIESNIEVMSKTDALLAAANDRKIAFHEERTTKQPQNNSRRQNSSSGTATGTGTIPVRPAAANKKDQKTPSSKKKTPGRARNNNSHRGDSEYTILPGYLNNDDMDGGCDWAVCDKDCGWCGRCRLY